MTQCWFSDSKRPAVLSRWYSWCIPSKSFRLFFLSCVSGLLFLMVSPAQAACSNNSPPANTNVTCTGTDTVGVAASGNNVNVSVQSGASVSNNVGNSQAIDLLGSSTLTNLGSLTTLGFNSNTVILDGPNSTITNGQTGSISNSNGNSRGIRINSGANNAVINNSGSIAASLFAAIAAPSGPVSGSIKVVNNATGMISSPGSVEPTVSLAANSSLEVDNYGSIQATGGPNAIVLNSPMNTVLLGTSATITGNVIPQAGGNNTLILGDTGTANFNLNNVGPGLQYQNFTQMVKNNTSTWTVTGTNTLPWTVNQGTLNVTSGASIGGAVAINGGTVNLSAGNSTIGGNVTLGSAGTLTGIGVVMGNTSNGGTLAPGTQVPNPTAASVGNLTLQGDYTGQSGAALNLRTQLNGDNSPTDQLTINGAVSGVTQVYVSNLPGSNGALTTNGIPVILTQNGGPSGAFVLGRPAQAGLYQYLLLPSGNNWDLFSHIANPVNSALPPIPLYRCLVPAYMLGHVDDVEYGFSSVGDLHARVGELHTARESGGWETWGRVLGQDLRLDGSLFTAKHNHFELLQVGQDLGIFGGRTHTGAMLTLGGIQGDFYYPARATIGLDTRTGRMESQSAALGLYWTHFWEDRAYLDAVVQGNYYNNLYSDACPGATDSATQRGWGEVASIEGAYPIALQGSSQLLSWAVEPEAQVAYQHLGLRGFNDGISDISSVSDRVVRGRLGLRVFQQSNAAFMSPFSHFISPYLLANIYRDFRVPSDIGIAGTTLTNSLSKTWGEVGIGLNGAWLKYSISSFADVRYQSSLGHRRGIQGIIGLRVNI